MWPITTKQGSCLLPRTSGSGTTSLAWTYIKYVDTVTVFAKIWNKGHWPLDDLWPHIFWGLMCDSTQGSLCPSPMKIHQSMWKQWLFCKNLKQRSLTPRWPLTPHLLRSHVWLYARIIVSKSYENTLKYVDTVTLFAKTWTKGHWPLDDLWPHICWGLMCDSTQGSLCPSPMKIHQSMWIQWPFLQKKTRTKGHWPLDDLWPHICWGHMCDSTQGSLCPSPMKIHQSMWIQWPFLQKKTWTKGHWPLDDLWPHICCKKVTCVTLPKDHFVQVPWKYIKVCGYSEPFC